jgi:hypothetical protein
MEYPAFEVGYEELRASGRRHRDRLDPVAEVGPYRGLAVRPRNPQPASVFLDHEEHVVGADADIRGTARRTGDAGQRDKDREVLTAEKLRVPQRIGVVDDQHQVN